MTAPSISGKSWRVEVEAIFYWYVKLRRIFLWITPFPKSTPASFASAALWFSFFFLLRSSAAFDQETEILKEARKGF